MRLEPLDVEHLQPRVSQDPLDGVERQVAEVLVIDRVVLALGDEALEVRKLVGEDALRCQQRGGPGHEVDDVRDVGQDVVAEDEVSRPALLQQVLGRGQPEEALHGLDAHLPRGLRDRPGGLHPQAGDPGLDEVA